MKNLLLRAPSPSTSTLPPTFQIQHSFFAVGFTTPTIFLRNRTESTPHLCCRTKHSPSKAFPTKQELFLLQQELEENDEQIDDDSSFLSLSMKPDRNLGLLDDYETEELGYDCGPNHKSGYVALLGKPNVGKSTLANQMVGQKLSIVTDKPQTTRHRVLCICSGSDYQMVLYDTPGVLQEQRHKLDSMMMQNVRSATVNADCVLVLVDACKTPEKIDEVLEEAIGGHKDKPPTLLIMNKKDLIKPGEVAKKLEWYTKFTDVDEVIPVSAKYGHGVEDVKNWILSKLPNGPAYYPKDAVSEHPERFFVAEIVREKIFLQYRNEIPYVCQVNVISYKARPNAKDFIQVEILVERSSQKIIIIGKEGKFLKLLATAARLDVEDFLQKKVFLEIKVKVKENWRQDEGFLKHSGYGGQIGIVDEHGFRFHPTDEELVDYYLRKKVSSKKIDLDIIKDVDLYKIEPWDLQELCKIGSDEQNDWYFFSHKDKKYPTGTRTNRATKAGFWKATGRDKAIYSKQFLVGMRKTLVFYKGRAPNGQKSDWIMHEYRLETNQNGISQLFFKWRNRLLFLLMNPKRMKFLRNMLQLLPPVATWNSGSEHIVIT